MKYYFSMYLKTVIRSISTSMRHYEKIYPSNYSHDKAYQYLSQFMGGKVSLSTLEGYKDVACITLDHVEKKNGLSGKMMAELHDVVLQLEDSSSLYRAVVVRGTNGVFCSGGDLDFVKKIATPEDGYLMCTFMGNILHRLSDLPIVSIAQIEGFALGGGSELASSCDLRVVHKDAKVGFVQARMGVSPGWGGASKLIAALGRPKAIEMLASASVLTSQQLKEVGFANMVYDNAEQFDGFVKKFTKVELKACQAAKKVVVDVGRADTWESKLKAERDIFTTLWGGEIQRTILNGSKPKHN